VDSSPDPSPHPAPTPDADRRRQTLIIALLGVVIVLLAAIGVVLVTGDEATAPDSDVATGNSLVTSEPQPVDGPVTTPAAGPDAEEDDDEANDAALSGMGLASGEILLEPVGIATANAFTPTMTKGSETAPAVPLPALPIPTTTAPLQDGQVPLAQIPGNEPGLYGGTRDAVDCDTEQLDEFLRGNPGKGRAWAEVQGIDPKDISDFIGRLTPLKLTRDTRVTNHGFVDGKAAAHPSVLQAGHSVLVDETGVPRAKCSCGNPLAPPQLIAGTPSYIGPAWPGWDPAQVIVVVGSDPVTGGFVIVDLGNGDQIFRPVGSEPDRLDGQIVELVNIGNIGGIQPGSSIAPTFVVDEPTLLISIVNYHYGPQTAPGQLGVITADGTQYGPWQAVGSDGQGGVANAYWTAIPDTVIPPGSYTVSDSEPSTWSTNAEAGGIGFSVVRGVVGVALPPVAEPAWRPDAAAGQILDLILLDCGIDYVSPFTDGGGDENGWRWLVDTPEGTADFFIGFSDGPVSWYIDRNNDLAERIALRCGFAEMG
jgi:hypothetical protein